MAEGTPEDRAKPYRFLLRMPEELRGELADASSRSDLSLNSEIVRRLERSLADERRAVVHAASRLRLRRALVAVGTTGAAALVAAFAVASGDGGRSPARMQADQANLGAKLSQTSSVVAAPQR
jgi:hypothetical protein